MRSSFQRKDCTVSARRSSLARRYNTRADMARAPVVLGIETSCDDTAIAVVDADRKVLHRASTSQWALHWREFKGVNPALALREHEIALPSLLSEWQKKQSDILGLAMALQVGVKHASEYAKRHKLPLMGINHLAAHCLVARLTEPTLAFPYLSLLVSGGHSQLLLCEGINKFHLLGGTYDDAVGEAYDKVARLLNLDASNMPAGEALQCAAEGAERKHRFTVPLRGVKDCNFSFSGLKSQVAREIAKSDLGNTTVVKSIAAGFQEAAVQHLCDRTARAISRCTLERRPVKVLAVVGGVARNTYIRTRLAELCKHEGVSLVFPPPDLCSDNGVMIAWTSVEHLMAGIAKPVEGELDIQPRWQLDNQAMK